MKTRITDMLGIKVPIVQAPMAGVSTPLLAAAVSNAGALGSLGAGAAGAEGALKMMLDTHALTKKPWHVNFFAHDAPRRENTKEQRWIEMLAPLFSELGATPPPVLSEVYSSFLDDSNLLEVVLEARPRVVSFHFGLPREEQISAMRDRGSILMASATSVEEAQKCECAGMDAVIVQGVEAGGHRGVHSGCADQELGLMALLPQVMDAVSIPVIASGGIVDGRGVAAALALGADGVQLGTAFVPCPESAAGERHRAILGTAQARRTLLTKGVSGRAARGLRNRLLETVLENESEAPDYPLAYDAAKSLAMAARDFDRDGFEVMWAGEAGALARKMPAAELVEMLACETKARLKELSFQMNAGNVAA